MNLLQTTNTYFSNMDIAFELNGTLDNWVINFHSECREPGVEIVTWELISSDERTVPEIKISFTVANVDCQVKWHFLNTLAQSHHFLPNWWDGRKLHSGLAHDAPVFCYMNQAGSNRITFALSDAKNYSYTSTGAREAGHISADITLFSIPDTITNKVDFSLRIDQRSLNYASVLQEIAQWYASLPGYKPAVPPKAAEEPLYSTWYQYQKDVFQDELEKELPLIADYGIKTIILDDGWQCIESQESGDAAYTNCGKWEVETSKFPDIASHVRKFHEYGIKYMVWFAVPFVGEDAIDIRKRFNGKFLQEGRVSIIDPRYPDVREYLINIYENAVREWDIDGLKLDFIDSFKLPEEDPAAEKYDDCDFINLADAVDCLLSETITRLKQIKPEILIEFRQHYNGPAIRKYGNMLRASDCAFDVLQNRVRTVDMRLLAGNTPVHSDMIIWSHDDTSEIAALQFINILFSVPQISVRLQELPTLHQKMLKFWIKFWKEHKETLLHGSFLPENPENSYPIVKALGNGENIIAVYEPGKSIDIPAEAETYLINGSHSCKITVELEKNAEVTFYNVYGEKNKTEMISSGLSSLKIPQSGFALFQSDR